MMKYDEVKDKINEILEIGDKIKASSKILELNDLVTTAEAEDTAKFNELENTVTEKTNRIAELEQENSDIRNANADIMLKYGELLTHQQQPIIEKKKVEVEEEKPLSWNEIAEME